MQRKESSEVAYQAAKRFKNPQRNRNKDQQQETKLQKFKEFFLMWSDGTQDIGMSSEPAEPWTQCRHWTRIRGIKNWNKRLASGQWCYKSHECVQNRIHWCPDAKKIHSDYSRNRKALGSNKDWDRSNFATKRCTSTSTTFVWYQASTVDCYLCQPWCQERKGGKGRSRESTTAKCKNVYLTMWCIGFKICQSGNRKPEFEAMVCAFGTHINVKRKDYQQICRWSRVECKREYWKWSSVWSMPQGRMNMTSFPKSEGKIKTTTAHELIRSNVMGPMQTKSRGRVTYIVKVINYYSWYMVHTTLRRRPKWSTNLLITRHWWKNKQTSW